jgi:hypothetical protein
MCARTVAEASAHAPFGQKTIGKVETISGRIQQAGRSNIVRWIKAFTFVFHIGSNNFRQNCGDRAAVNDLRRSARNPKESNLNMYNKENLAKLTTMDKLAPEVKKAFWAFDKAAVAEGAMPVKCRCFNNLHHHLPSRSARDRPHLPAANQQRSY